MRILLRCFITQHLALYVTRAPGLWISFHVGRWNTSVALAGVQVELDWLPF